MEMSTLGERIKQARTAAGLKQREVAEPFGIDRANVAQWENDTSRPDADRFGELADILKVDLDWLMTEKGKAPSPSPRPPASARAAPGADDLKLGERDVPIMGTSVGGKDGEFYLNGETVDYARRLPGIAKNKNVFGVHVEGDSMVPKYEPGELVYASPRAAAPGDYVIIELTPRSDERAGPAYIKRLVRRSGNKVVCEQFNPARNVEYDAREVKAIYRIIPLAELAGF